MADQTPTSENSPFQAMVEGIAQVDIFHHLDALFGHWWNRPFWKAKNPMAVFLENLTWRGYKRFSILRTGEISGDEAEVFLRNHGVYIWGRGFDSEHLYFNVKREQASYAEYMMLRQGVALTSAPVNPRNQEWAEKYNSAPPGWGSNKRTFWDFIGLGSSGTCPRSFGTSEPTRRSGRSRTTARKQTPHLAVPRLNRAQGRSRRPSPPRRPFLPKRISPPRRPDHPRQK